MPRFSVPPDQIVVARALDGALAGLRRALDEPVRPSARLHEVVMRKAGATADEVEASVDSNGVARATVTKIALGHVKALTVGVTFAKGPTE